MGALRFRILPQLFSISSFLVDSTLRPECLGPWFLFPVSENLKRNMRAHTLTFSLKHTHLPLLRAVKSPHTYIRTPKRTYFSNLPKSPKAWGGGGSLLPHLAQEKPVWGPGEQPWSLASTPPFWAGPSVPVILTPGLPSCWEVNECAGQTSSKLPAAPL